MTETARPDEEARPRRRYAVWGREVPAQNRHFTGRDKELAELRRKLVDESTALIGQPSAPLYGLGGVGKTEIAVEYAHRFRDNYDLIWWVRAEQEDTIRNSLIALGQRLRLPDFRGDERDYSADLVIDALASGDASESWLLIFDNAANAEMVSRYIPRGRGHVIITSRDTQWHQVLRTDGIEVAEFEDRETIEFLRKRVPALKVIEPAQDAGTDEIRMAHDENDRRDRDAAELAKGLANLPLAAEHAAAYLVETGRPVSEYLEQFNRSAHQLLGSAVDIYYPAPVATAWRVSRERISHNADELFQLLAFFSSEPISHELLMQPGRLQSVPKGLEEVLSDVAELRSAARELARFSLIKIDGIRNVLQLHRVVQAVTESRLKRENPAKAAEYRNTAHALLAASDPHAPDHDGSGPAYELSRQHLIPSGALKSENPLVRTLIINQVRRLRRRGGFTEALSLGELALKTWTEQFGQDDRQTLALAVEVGFAMRDSGRWQEALQLNADSRERLLRQFGEDDQTSLTCGRSYGIDLTMLGQYDEALSNDLHLLPLYERVFRAEHPDTLQMRNNIAISLRCLGRFKEALEFDQETFAERERVLGYDDTGTLISKWAIARTLRRLGDWEEALRMIREVCDTLEQKGEPWNASRLMAAADLVVSLRRIGFYEDAAREGRVTLDRHISVLGEEHRQTLYMATNFINDLRLNDDMAAAQQLGERTVRSWERVVGEDHPNTVAARANLAIALRMRGNPTAAHALNEQAHRDFLRIFDDRHPSPLVVMTNLASDLAMLGEVGKARRLGEQTLEASREVRGPDHPATLAVAANLSIDRRADGDEGSARELYEATVNRYAERLGPEHPESRLAAQRGRATVDIDLMIT